MTDVFGPLISRSSIDQAILNLLSTPPETGAAALILYYLAAVERQMELPARTLPQPPGPSSYRSEVDFETFQAEWLPLIGVDSQPTGRIERHEGGEYGQWYETRVAVIVGDDDEDLARMFADAYAIAVAAAILQNGSLGGIATETRLVNAPIVEYVNPDVRQVSRATVTLQTYVQPILIEYAGKPVSWPADPYGIPTGYPEVQTVDVTAVGVEELPAGDSEAAEVEAEPPTFVAAATLPRLS